MKTVSETKIGFVGLGYVGTVSAAGFAILGFDVYGYDLDERKVTSLINRQPLIYESGLQEVLLDADISSRMHFVYDIDNLVDNADVIFVTVGTPESIDGSCNTSFVTQALESILSRLTERGLDSIVVVKSTVPVGFTQEFIDSLGNDEGICRNICFSPEFLREGSALDDFLNPSRVVIGTTDASIFETVAHLYGKYESKGVPILMMDPTSAELVKYASNSFLAAKVALINEFADLSHAVGANIDTVSRAIGMDPRIGNEFMRASVGFGGSCFPKDVSEIDHRSNSLGIRHPLIGSILESNRAHIERMTDRIDRCAKHQGIRTISILGLAFKPDSDDIRESPAIEIASKLLERGYVVKASDPLAGPNALLALPKGIEILDNAYDCMNEAEMVTILTGWRSFRELKFCRSGSVRIVMDLANVLDGETIGAMGLEYHNITE